MSENTLKTRFKHPYKTEAEWKSANPVLYKGELAYSSDKKQWKTGDGSSKWSDLTYDKADPTDHNHDSSYLKLSGGTVTGVTSFTNTTVSTSKSTGAVKFSGGVGVAGRMSANEIMIGDGCTLKYDSTNKCVNFVFS